MVWMYVTCTRVSFLSWVSFLTCLTSLLTCLTSLLTCQKWPTHSSLGWVCLDVIHVHVKSDLHIHLFSTCQKWPTRSFLESVCLNVIHVSLYMVCVAFKMPKETFHYVSFDMSEVTFTCLSVMGLFWHGPRLFWHGLRLFGQGLHLFWHMSRLL